MTMNPARPVLLSVVQYDRALRAGAMDVSAVLRTARSLGVDGVEVRPDYLQDPARELHAVQDVAGQLGLLLTYATMATLFTEGSGGVQALRQDIADARTLGAALLRIFPGTVPDSADDPGWDRAQAAVAEAARQGVVLALENFGRAPGCTVHEIRQVLERLGPAGLVTNIDIGNYAGAGEDVPAAIRALGAWARAAHLKDQPAAPDDPGATYLGGGALPLPAILDALDRLPQRLLLCFEFGGGADPDEHIRRSLTYLRQR